MIDNQRDELLVNLSADQTEHLAPFIVAAVLVEQGNQSCLAQRFGNIKLMYEVRGAEIL